MNVGDRIRVVYGEGARGGRLSRYVGWEGEVLSIARSRGVRVSILHPKAKHMKRVLYLSPSSLEVL